jgi:predicted RNase H-like nuclease (RuvC/YqgF family)
MIQSLKRRVRKEERRNRMLIKRLGRRKAAEEIAGSGNALPVKVLDALTRDALHRLSLETGLSEGDVLFVIRTDGWGRSVVRELADAGVMAVITGASALSGGDPQLLPAFRESDVPLLPAEGTGVVIKGKIGQVPADRLDAALDRWQEEQEQQRKEKQSELVEHIFKEYKSERGKEVRKSG